MTNVGKMKIEFSKPILPPNIVLDSQKRELTDADLPFDLKDVIEIQVLNDEENEIKLNSIQSYHLESMDDTTLFVDV